MDPSQAVRAPESSADRLYSSLFILSAAVALSVAAMTLYRLRSPNSSTFTVAGDKAQHGNLDPPTTFVVHPDDPDPFRPSTTIRYDVPAATDIEIVIYNSERRAVDSFHTSHDAPGRFAVTWNDPLSPNGLYLARLRSGRYDTGYALLLK